MKIVRPNDDEYKADCVLANDRFYYLPRAIYYCENADEVKTAIKDSGGTSGSVRIRAGGHHHAGMCSANGKLLIDVSRINTIEYEGDRVWIGAGASLKAIYSDLWQNGCMFPGGGCLDVHVGGLAQGGGWDRCRAKFGLTCDSLVGVEMVTAEAAASRPSRRTGRGPPQAAPRVTRRRGRQLDVITSSVSACIAGASRIRM